MSSSDSSIPTATEIMNMVESMTVQQAAARGLRGFIYTIGLFVISIFTGFLEIIQSYLRAIGGGVGATMAALFGSFARLIREGAITTVNNFLLPKPFGFIEGLLWTLVAVFVVQWAMEYFGTDIFILPGFELIPFFGNEADGDEGQ